MKERSMMVVMMEGRLAGVRILGRPSRLHLADGRRVYVLSATSPSFTHGDDDGDA